MGFGFYLIVTYIIGAILAPGLQSTFYDVLSDPNTAYSKSDKNQRAEKISWLLVLGFVVLAPITVPLSVIVVALMVIGLL